jgi:Flp pilus assembly protein TadB
MSKNTKSGSGSIGFTGLLAILFIALKLCGVITWSWWIVLSPIWIVSLLVGGIILIVLLAQFATRPKTPQEKAAAACRDMARALRSARDNY